MAYNLLSTELGFWSYIIMSVIYILAFMVHEFAKVIIANFVAEDSVKKGVPLSDFIEPVGFILMFGIGVGWSRNAEINAVYFKDRKKDTLKIYLGAILVTGIIGVALMTAGIKIVNNSSFYLLKLILLTFGQTVLAVSIMNLLPATPFSGYKILSECLPPNARMKLISNEKIIQMIVMFLVVIGVVGDLINSLIGLVLTGILLV